jgi:hypothetical protein
MVKMPKMPPATLPAARATRPTASPPGARRPLHRLAHRQVFLQPSLADQELLCALEHLGPLIPQRLRLLHERREDEDEDQRDRAQNREIQHEDREPPRHPLRDAEPLALEDAHDRAEADRQDDAHVHDQQRAADDVGAPEDDAGERRHHDGVADERATLFGGPRSHAPFGPRARNSPVNSATRS